MVGIGGHRPGDDEIVGVAKRLVRVATAERKQRTARAQVVVEDRAVSESLDAGAAPIESAMASIRMSRQ